jgi:hypothetical protein
MADTTVLLLASAVFLISNLVFNGSIWRQSARGRFVGLPAKSVSQKIVLSGVIANLIGGLLIGLSLGVRVHFSSEPSYWFVPLIIAPFGYWSSFGVFILLWIFLVHREFSVKSS